MQKMLLVLDRIVIVAANALGLVSEFLARFVTTIFLAFPIIILVLLMADLSPKPMVLKPYLYDVYDWSPIFAAVGSFLGIIGMVIRFTFSLMIEEVKKFWRNFKSILNTFVPRFPPNWFNEPDFPKVFALDSFRQLSTMVWKCYVSVIRVFFATVLVVLFTVAATVHFQNQEEFKDSVEKQFKEVNDSIEDTRNLLTTHQEDMLSEILSAHRGRWSKVTIRFSTASNFEEPTGYCIKDSEVDTLSKFKLCFDRAREKTTPSYVVIRGYSSDRRVAGTEMSKGVTSNDWNCEIANRRSNTVLEYLAKGEATCDQLVCNGENVKCCTKTNVELHQEEMITVRHITWRSYEGMVSTRQSRYRGRNSRDVYHNENEIAEVFWVGFECPELHSSLR